MSDAEAVETQHGQPDQISTTAVGPAGDALQLLQRLDDAPLAEHPEIYRQIHESLRGALTGIDQA